MKNKFQCFDTLRKQSAPFRLISFEDYRMGEIVEYLREVNEFRPIEARTKIFNVLILRDAHNQLASKMASPKIGRRLPLAGWSEYWVEFAKVFQSPQAAFQDPVVCIKYNDWLTDMAYRESIAQSLELEFTDKGFADKLNFSWGYSSFKEEEDVPNAQLNRSESVKENSVFQKLLNYPELKNLSVEIFGAIV